MYKTNDLVYVKYHDLKSDIYVVVYFHNPNDLIEFFSKYNPCSIDIINCHVNYGRDLDNVD